MKYNSLNTLEDLAQFGVNIDKIIQVQTPTFDPDTLQYNNENKLKNCNVKTQWFWKETVDKINNYPKRVYWYAGNRLDINEFERPEFQSTGMYGAIRLYFEAMRIHVITNSENTQITVNGEIMFEGEKSKIEQNLKGLLCGFKLSNVGCTITWIN